MIKRKIITVLIILTMISFAFSGCGKKEDEFDDYALFQDEVETVVSGDPAKERGQFVRPLFRHGIPCTEPGVIDTFFTVFLAV